MSYLFYSCLSHFSEVCSVTTAMLEEPWAGVKGAAGAGAAGAGTKPDLPKWAPAYGNPLISPQLLSPEFLLGLRVLSCGQGSKIPPGMGL